MDNSSTYDTDILVWSEQQASALRDLAQSRRDLPNELDLKNVAEEIECVGRSELAAVQSPIRQILVQVIKAASITDAAPMKHWRAEVIAFHASIFDHLSPSMVPRLQMNATWRRARRTAEAELTEYGQALAENLPLDCPFEPADIVNQDFDFARAGEQVRAAIGSADPAG